MHVGIAADDHLGRSFAKDIERRPRGPVGDQTVRLLPELGGGKIERDYFAAVEIADEIQSSHGVTHCRIEIVGPAAMRRKRLFALWRALQKRRSVTSPCLNVVPRHLEATWRVAIPVGIRG